MLCVVLLTASFANSRVVNRLYIQNVKNRLYIQNVKATLVFGVMMAVRSCWQSRSVFQD